MASTTRTRAGLSSLTIAAAFCFLATVGHSQSCTGGSVGAQATATSVGILVLTLDQEQRDWVSIGRLSSEWTGPSNPCSSDCDDYDDDFPRRTSTHRYCLDPVSDPPQVGDRRWRDSESIKQVGGTAGYDNNVSVWWSEERRCLNGRYDARTWATTYEIGAEAEEYSVLDGYKPIDLECPPLFPGDSVMVEVGKDVVRVRYSVSSKASGAKIVSGVLVHGLKNDIFEDVHVLDGEHSYSYTITVKQ